MNKVALITGTSTGIGLDTAVALASEGFKVVATMRNLDKSQTLRDAAAAKGLDIDLRQLDVQDEQSVQSCVDGAVTDHGSLDVLVNNAGAGCVGTLEQTTMDDLQRTMDINFYGVWRATRAALPQMRKQGGGRIISVSSIGGLFGVPFNDAYCAAKFAVEGLMESLAPVLAKLGIAVSIVEPGPVNTQFVASVTKTAAAAVAREREAYGALMDRYLANTRETFADLGQTGEDIAKVIVQAATTETPHFRYGTSEMVQAMVKQKYVDPTGDSVVAMAASRLS